MCTAWAYTIHIWCTVMIPVRKKGVADGPRDKGTNWLQIDRFWNVDDWFFRRYLRQGLQVWIKWPTRALKNPNHGFKQSVTRNLHNINRRVVFSEHWIIDSPERVRAQAAPGRTSKTPLVCFRPAAVTLDKLWCYVQPSYGGSKKIVTHLTDPTSNNRHTNQRGILN